MNKFKSQLFAVMFLFSAASIAHAGKVNFECECQQSAVDKIEGIVNDKAFYVCNETQGDDYYKEMNYAKQKGKVELQQRMMILDPSQTSNLTKIEIRFAPRNDATMKKITDEVQLSTEWDGSTTNQDWKTIDNFNLENTTNEKGTITAKTAIAGFGGLKNGSKWSYAVSAVYFLHPDGKYKASAICMGDV